MDFERLKRIQEDLARKACFRPLQREIRVVAGMDVAYSRNSERAYPAMVLMRWPDLELLEEITLLESVNFPYIPGYLSFREVPLLKAVVARAVQKPDLIFVDGQGLAHPRRAGLAVHLGVELGLPTIGCAKRPLAGEFVWPEEHFGATSPILFHKEVVGYVLRSRKGVKPIFVSPGNLITPEEALDYTLRAIKGFRLPEPLRKAHLLSVKARKNHEG